MKRPTFLRGVCAAAALATFGSIGFTALTSFTLVPGFYHALMAALSLMYLLYLLANTEERVGRATAIAVWTVASLLLWLLGLSATTFLLVQIVILWLIRSLYFYNSALAAALDLGLNLLALAAAFWAGIHTGSVFLTLWCFFLVQALFVAIPPAVSRSNNSAKHASDDLEKFERAKRNAEKAMQQLFAR